MNVRVNPIRSRDIWEAQRFVAQRDPGVFHGAIARREIHWYDPALNAWIIWDDKRAGWLGLQAETGMAIEVPYTSDYNPWQRAFNGDDPPFYRWFEGGLTNACFNEVDRHVLNGYGHEIAYYFEGDRWDQSLNKGRGGPVVSFSITRKKLMLEVVKAAQALQDLGLKQGDCIVLNLPNIIEQIYYTEAAKRLGIIYTPVFGGFSDKTLSDRIHDAGARVVITSDGGYRNAQIVPYKETYTDPALDKYVPVETALKLIREVLEEWKNQSSLSTPFLHREEGAGGTARPPKLSDIGDVLRIREKLSQTTDLILKRVQETLSEEITVERQDIMRGVGRALEESTNLSAAIKSYLRTAVAAALVKTPSRIDTVIVVRHTGQPDLLWRPERDRWSHELMEQATVKLIAAARSAGIRVDNEEQLLALDTINFVRALYASNRPVPLDAEYPLFFIYTSGSTGKPKGVVHVHGGYTAGVAHTMKISFDAQPGDIMYVVADPGWITGQSYLITASLTCRITSVITEGTPVFPNAGRFASIIERYGVTIFKAGVTFLKSVMTDPQNIEDVRVYDMSTLRVATFCAEPVSPAVQQFGMEVMTPQYINSYWATEHGGIVWTHFYGCDDFPLQADAHTYPFPWVMGDVWVQEETMNDERGTMNENSDSPYSSLLNYRVANYEEKGEIVITAPYPYLARTIWGDKEHFKVEGPGISPDWRGDAERYVKTYWRRGPSGEWGYLQGDFAIKYKDGSFTLHGRSDDVINVSGHRIGTEEIEGAILRDKSLNPDSPVGNCIVVGASHREKGLTPVAFILTPPGRKLTNEDRARLSELVRNEKGVVAVPGDYIEVHAFPETRSGKYMRRFLRNMMLDEEIGDQTTLRNPEALVEIKRKIDQWKREQRASEGQQIFEIYRYFRIQYSAVAPELYQAIIIITNPPVNALNERAFDELNTILDHLVRRDDVKVVIFTGDGTKNFIAGADIKQLLYEMHTLEDVLSLCNNAHMAFRKIELMEKPCVAAINGAALGGGLEFALACHYRIAEPTAIFGQPEINLRLLPGYGGTQRLPRILSLRLGKGGLLAALEIMLNGRSIDANQALALGLVDEVVSDTDVLTRASALAREFMLPENEWEKLPYRRRIMKQAAESSRWTATALGRACDKRRWLAREWNKPIIFFQQQVEQSVEIHRILKQSAYAGREGAASWILEAVRYGYENGFEEGLEREISLFAQAVTDPEGGKAGIQAFLNKQSAPLPTRRSTLSSNEGREWSIPSSPSASSSGVERGVSSEESLVPIHSARAGLQALIERRELLPIGSPFYPGFTPLPKWQYAHAIIKDPETGKAFHDDPIRAEREIIIPVEHPGPNEALIYVLASEVNFNDIWALTGIPVSPFDNHDRDEHITGSGGIGLIAMLGSALKQEGRLKVGDLVTIYSGQSQLLSPTIGLDPMFADFTIQGYEGPRGSHQQFIVTQGPQIHGKVADLSLEAAGSYILKLGTIYRALFTTLKIVPDRTMFVEGAATGTGYEAVKLAARNDLRVVGLVSSQDRVEAVRKAGGQGAINRKEERFACIFTPVPPDPSQWAAWESAGSVLLDAFREQQNGRLADYVISHTGEEVFPRSFQLLEMGGTLAFYGASSGYHFTFMGKPRRASTTEILRRANLRAGEIVMIYYGPLDRMKGQGSEEVVGPYNEEEIPSPHRLTIPLLHDPFGLEAIEAAVTMGARVVIVTYTDAQRDFILSLGFGVAVRGVISLEEIQRREGDKFDWPATMPTLPNPFKDVQGFKDTLRRFNDLTFKPFGNAVGRFLRSTNNPRGYPDLIFERASHDALAVSTMLVKPYTGRIVYAEEMQGRRYSFYAPQVWMRQRRIYMPTASIWGTHLCNSYEVVMMNEAIETRQIEVTEPLLVPWKGLPATHQAMWENRHAGASYVVNHALPRPGIKTRDALYEAWAMEL